MNCPNCKQETLEKITFNKNQIERCSQCKGIWFNQDELRKAKDEEDQFLKWLDIDLWKDSEKFQPSHSSKICPTCKVNLYEVHYGGSDVRVDFCNKCKGIWLDDGEFKKIIAYLKNKVNTEKLGEYFKHTLEEAKEIFTGPEKLTSEIEDFFIVIKLLQYRLCSQHPAITRIITNLPFTK
ncbi:MAG: zf-TFIIB domain-containing protein [Candidatus Pacebacteria bacterium]|nr:zf-TFIIB domain-containing protein [Candidatus Paceibacterota bacterium]